MSRPENVACIRYNVVQPAHRAPRTWCGRRTGSFGEWLFQDIDHAALSAEAEDRMLVCKDCWNAILSVMEEGVYDDS